MHICVTRSGMYYIYQAGIYNILMFAPGHVRKEVTTRVLVNVYHLRDLCYMPAGIVLCNLILCYLCKLVYVISGTGVAVACGVRLSCSVFMVYSVLLSVSLVARALSIALRLQCAYVWREAWL